MDNKILAHTKYNCTYHIVFIPKYRRKAMYGKLGREVGEILSAVCKRRRLHTACNKRIKGVEIG